MRKSLPVIGSLALLLTILSLLCRADSWEEIATARLFNFVIIGPLWAAVSYFSFARRSKTAIAVSIAVYLLSASLLSTWNVAVVEARLKGQRMCCDNNLKQIGLALQQYEHRYGCLPPAYVPDAKGKPLHSWRVLLLPFLDQDALYRKYSFKEPWDGPNNRKLRDIGIGVYFDCVLVLIGCKVLCRKSFR